MHEKLRKISKYALPTLIILTGISFIAAALHIYFTGGDTPYTRERVGTYLLYLLIPAIPCFVDVVFEIVEALIFGKSETEAIKGTRTASVLLKSTLNRFNFDAADEETRTAIKKERKYRLTWYISATVLSVIAAVGTMLLVLTRDYTIENLNSDVIGAIVIALPISILVLTVWCAAIILCDISRMREIDRVKAATKKAPVLMIKPKEQKVEKNAEKWVILAARVAVFAIAVTFIVIGIINGGMADVLAKAVKICTECIGLG